MNEYTIDGILKREFKGLDNKEYWRVSKEIWKHVVEYGKAIEKAAKVEWENRAEEERVARAAIKAPEGMTDEEAREAFKKNLLAMGASGDFDAAMAGKLIDVLDLKATRKEVPIELVDFSRAFPDLASAIEICQRPVLDRIVEWLKSIGKKVI